MSKIDAPAEAGKSEVCGFVDSRSYVLGAGFYACHLPKYHSGDCALQPEAAPVGPQMFGALRIGDTPPISAPVEDMLCHHPSCGHPISMHDDGHGGCTAPSDHLSKDFGDELGEQPLPCICGEFRSSAPVEDTAVALKSCPFCGKQPRSKWHGCSIPGAEDCGYWGIDCCHAQSHADTEEDAAVKWNNRETSLTRTRELEKRLAEVLDVLQTPPHLSEAHWLLKKAVGILSQGSGER